MCPSVKTFSERLISTGSARESVEWTRFVSDFLARPTRWRVCALPIRHRAVLLCAGVVRKRRDDPRCGWCAALAVARERIEDAR
jgi:hypothetical protein